MEALDESVEHKAVAAEHEYEAHKADRGLQLQRIKNNGQVIQGSKRPTKGSYHVTGDPQRALAMRMARREQILQRRGVSICAKLPRDTP